ncbi:MAG: HAMP domain-containing protein, partial [Candidatus Obscuribacterales bacterium]|nr:HAMP domain-containing protein [Steroidobacteraceae bacterium]
MEHVLKTGQEAAILTTAQTLARVIATDVDVFGSASSPQSLTSPPVRDQYAVQLTTHPLLDGFADEWPLTTRSLPSDTSTALSNDSGLRFGLYDGTLYAFLRVSDAQVTYENPMSSAERTTPLPDRVIVLLGSDETSSDGASFQHAWSISAAAPGPIIAHRAVNAAPWLPQSQLDADLRGVWRESADGYYVELRIPQRFVGSRIAIFSSDDAAPTTEEVTLQRLISASAALRERLARYAPPGVRISILNAQGWLLARVGSVGDTTESYNSAPASQDDASLNVYRFFLGRTEATPAPSYGLPYGMWGEPIDAARRGASSAIWFHATANEPSIVRAAVPILNGDRVAGVIAVEQRGEQLLTQRDAALERLLALTLLTTVFAMGLSLVFGLWLARRIRHLSKAAAHALSPEGHIEQRLPDTAARDELGDLARSYATLLGRLKDYTQYLQTLG